LKGIQAMMENDLQNMENAGVLRRCIGAMQNG